MKKKQQLIKEAKSLGLYVTDNHNAVNAAKNLFTANQRIIELEAIIKCDATQPLHLQLINNYNQKWNKE